MCVCVCVVVVRSICGSVFHEKHRRGSAIGEVLEQRRLSKWASLLCTILTHYVEVVSLSAFLCMTN